MKTTQNFKKTVFFVLCFCLQKKNKGIRMGFEINFKKNECELFVNGISAGIVFDKLPQSIVPFVAKTMSDAQFIITKPLWIH